MVASNGGDHAAAALRDRDPAGATGNFGIDDQRAALRWVAANKAVFGGGEVIIFGESAGAGSVANHYTTPASRGLFARALAESGFGARWNSLPLDIAEEQHASRVLYVVLTGAVTGKLVAMMMNISLKNGFEAWRRVHVGKEPVTGNHQDAAMQALMNITFEGGIVVDERDGELVPKLRSDFVGNFFVELTPRIDGSFRRGKNGFEIDLFLVPKHSFSY